MADNAQELFEHGLKDIYDAEHKLVRALAKMAKDVEDEKLSQGFEQHRKVTEGQVDRLEKVFELMDRRPSRQPCPGIDGLIKEYSKFVREEKPEPAVLNVFATEAAKKVEYYEIVSYRGLIELANQLGEGEAARLLQETLREEEQTAQQLERMSKQLGRELAAVTTEEEEE
jgi:ferritin-like metal-binding protein YciE